MKMNKLLALCIILITSFSYAQEMKFSGVVNDTINDQPLENAVVMAVRLSDSKLLGFTRTEADGSFNLSGVIIDTMELVVSHHKFDEKRYYIIGSEENNEIHIPNIILPEQATQLDEVVVYANKEPIYFRGDTLVYVADSFATKENAMVEDLLKNLPGLEVDDDGNVSSQGQKVTKVLVDGDEFFGSDPTIATRNLTADGVEKVEVYEAEDETSSNSEEKIQVLDVKLKEDAKKGYFGKVAGSGGFNSEYFKDLPNGSGFYEGEVLANYFNKDLKVSVFALGSNTPNTGFSYRDASRFGLTNEMNGGWRSTMGGSNLNGLPENYKGGFYFSNKLTDKLKLGVNYTYNDSRLTTEQVTNSEYFFTDTTYSKQDSSFNEQMQQSHTVNFNLEYDLNKSTKLSMKSNLTVRNEESLNTNESNFLNTDGQRFSATNVRNESKADGLEGNVELELNKKFKKRFRELDVLYQFGYTEMERNNGLNSELYYGQFATPDSIFDQQRNIENNTTGHRVTIDYVEPITRSFRLKFQYKLDYFYGQQATSTFDRTPTGYDAYASLYSNDFSNTRMENRGALGLLFKGRKQSIEIGSRVRNVMIDNLNNESGEVINQNVDNILPYLEYSYNFSNAHKLRFVYSTYSSQPSLDQLQPVRDNSNPNSLVIGNPNLQPNYTHNMNLNYNKWNALKQSYLYAGAYFNYTDNAFSNSVYYSPTGQSVSTAINVDGNMYGGFYAGGGIPIFKKLLSLRPQASGNYYKSNSEINNVMNTIENYSVDGELGIEMRTDTIEVSISAGLSYNDPRSSLSSGLNEAYTVQRYKASVFYELPWRFFIESDAVYEINSQRAEGFNATPFIWNAKLNKRFLKTGNLVVHASIYDIFNQNIGISRNVGTNIITDVRSRIIARYFMIGATLRFNNNKTKADEGRGHWF
ncbi:TonB-dependent receptor [Brumimicrobium aurantiacum]|uniref:TonB-dependent receptor n=2 Tax=Brumimicrobium aurantiacum TaxID=1737063 RepID=A0A3E1EV37_9FLAO|nr:TonB-dependent receptor [Brumimicrobium aurantiacum]